MDKSLPIKFGMVCCLIAAGSARAAGQDDSLSPSLHVAGGRVYPNMGITEMYKSNLYRSDINKKGSAITVLTPSVMYKAEKGANKFTLAYSAELGRYARSAADNYTNHDLLASGDFALGRHASLRISPEYKVGHDDRGSVYTVFTPSPNRWRNSGIDGQFSYGSYDSIGRLVLDLSTNDLTYLNNRTYTAGFDKTLDNASGTFYYRVAPKVHAFVELANKRIRYHSVSTLSSNELRTLVGATWLATAQTTGSFKIGQLRKKFDSAQHPTYRGGTWEGKIRWVPRTFLSLEWTTTRTVTETSGVGDFVSYSNNQVDLGYDMNDRTSLHFSGGRLVEDFSQTGRRDVTPSYGLEADYRLRKWLVLNASYLHSVKTSTGYAGTGGYVGASPNYHNNIFSVGLHTEFN